jgi:hypothetical protein
MDVNDLVGTIEEERMPVLVPINAWGYYHFVIVRGFRGDRVFLADPAVGNTTMKISRFEEVWVDGIGFVVTPPSKRANRFGPLLASANGSGSAATDATPGSPGSAAAGSEPRSDGGIPPLLVIRKSEPLPDSVRLRTFLDQTEPPLVKSDAVQSFSNGAGDRVLSQVLLPNFRGTLQFGQPAGNFVDFSPKTGQPIHVAQ